jgi:MgtE-like protein
MSADVASAAEIQKLAHTLGVEPERLASLAAVPARDLGQLRAQIADALFEADKPHFAKMAALSKAVPVALAARVTEHVLPPLLAARTAELIEPGRAVEMVARMSDGYLAEVSAAMDPGRAPEVIARLPPERVAKVGRELARREEWVVIGGFVAHVSDAALAVTVTEFTGEQLLRIGFVLDDKTRLDDISRLLSDEQVDDLLAAAAAGRWSELDDLLAHLGPEGTARLRVRFAAAPADVTAAIRAAAAAGELSPTGLARLTS